MKFKAYLLAFFLIFALLAAFGSKGESQTASPVTWEYKIVHSGGPIDEKKLDELGAQGWEMTGVRTNVFRSDTLNAIYYFKRPR